MLRDEMAALPNVPFYSDLPVSAGVRDAYNPAAEKPTGYISLPSQRAECYFPVVGTSMEPEIHEGDIVGVVRVDSLNEISPGSIYLILTNDSRMIKRCHCDEHNAELLWCVSPNYPSFTINKRDICAMFQVVNRIERL
jgi:phage repressor protein C with HTH and peptisase S24 domain